MKSIRNLTTLSFILLLVGCFPDEVETTENNAEISSDETFFKFYINGNPYHFREIGYTTRSTEWFPVNDIGWQNGNYFIVSWGSPIYAADSSDLVNLQLGDSTFFNDIDGFPCTSDGCALSIAVATGIPELHDLYVIARNNDHSYFNKVTSVEYIGRNGQDHPMFKIQGVARIPAAQSQGGAINIVPLDSVSYCFVVNKYS